MVPLGDILGHVSVESLVEEQYAIITTERKSFSDH